MVKAVMFVCQFLCKLFPRAWVGKTRGSLNSTTFTQLKEPVFHLSSLAGDFKELLELWDSKQHAFRGYGCNIICFCDNLLSAIESVSRALN